MDDGNTQFESHALFSFFSFVIFFPLKVCFVECVTHNVFYQWPMNDTPFHSKLRSRVTESIQ